MYSYLDHCAIWCKLTTDGLFGSTYSKICGLVVARYGVEGATLEKTAEETDLARALIRQQVSQRLHHLGIAKGVTLTFIGHPSAGWRSAVIYSIVGTCKLINVNPEAYLAWVLPKLAAATTKTTDGLLPHDFAERQLDDARFHRGPVFGHLSPGYLRSSRTPSRQQKPSTCDDQKAR